MIAYIKGKIAHKSPTHIYLESGGIGYLVYVSLNTFSAIQDKAEVKLYIHPYFIKEAQALSGIALYGFFEEKEKELFQYLISISGVGASSATLALSAMTTDELVHAIQTENEAKITSIKGVGPKTAKRLILELKDKVSRIQTGTINSASSNNTIRDEALSALVALGFNKAQSDKTLNKILSGKGLTDTVEDLIKQALKQM